MNEHDRTLWGGATSEAELTKTLESMGEGPLQSVLHDLASALFPSNAGTLGQVTWDRPAGEGRRMPADQPPAEHSPDVAAKIHAAELRYRTLVEQIPAITFMAMLGEGQNEIYVSPHIEMVLGFPQQEWLDNPFLWFSQIHPDDRMVWIDEFARGCRTGGPFRAECRFMARDGRVVWIRGEARLIKDEQGRPSFLQGVAFDITETKEAHAAGLQRAVSITERRYRDLVEHLGAIFWEVEAQSGRFTFVSRGTEEILRFPRDRWLADPRFWINQVHPDDRDGVAVAWARALREGGDHEFQFRATTADGEIRWLHNQIHVPDVTGRDRHAVGLILDITDRKRIEHELASTIVREQSARAELINVTERRRSAEALQASEERYRRIVDSAHEGIWLTDAAAHTEYVNGRMAEILGYSREELIGRRFLDFVDPAARAEAERHVESRRKGISEELDLLFRRSDGSEVWTILSTTPVFEEGQYVGAVNMLLDVTERRQLEGNLRQAQKMDAVGQLAGGVAHDFNNLLTAILGYSELAEASLAEDDPVRADIGEIRRAGDSAAALTRQLLAFSRKQLLQPQVVDLNDVIIGMQKMLGRLIGENIELVVTVIPGVGMVKVDPGQMEQVILNLAVNARDAMPSGGKLTIRKADVDVDKAYAAMHVGMTTGQYVRLSISDTGTGISPETLAHMFEPFFTTKELGKGTGLGLATVYGIVKQSGGYIAVNSELGVGSTFSVHLPRVDEEAHLATEIYKTPVPIRGVETILLVEDDAAVRRLALEALQRAGYTVMAASNGQEALQLAAIGSFDLLLTDVVMPKMGGQEVAKRLKSERPDLKVLFMSGYADTDNAIDLDGLGNPGTAFLHKPFTPKGLTAKVRELLDAS